MKVGKWGLVVGFLGLVCVGGWAIVIRMPGSSYQGALPTATGEEQALEKELHTHVHTLGRQIGERNLYQYPHLLLAAEYIRGEFGSAGLAVRRQEFTVSGKTCENIEAEIPGTGEPEEIIVVGAHYDSVKGSPGANDNGTGVAAMLVLARQFVHSPPSRTLRFVAFVNEEPPFFQTQDMGSWVYAKAS